MNFWEVVSIAFSSIRSNKLRSILTLLGIVVGVFSIIAVMTAVRVLQSTIETELTNLGTNTFQVQKYPVQMFGGHDMHRRYHNRKNINYDQAIALHDRMTLASNVGLEGYEWGKTFKSAYGESRPMYTFFGENNDGLITNNWNVKEGRGLTDQDLQYAKRVIILGADVIGKIFPKVDPIGQEVRVDGERYTVIGIFERKGGSFGGRQDGFGVIPLTTFLNRYGWHRSLNIMVRAKNAALLDEAQEEARGILRTVRKVQPGAEDDFAFFTNDSLIQQFNDFTFYVKVGVAFISFIALLAAGVGIMNIMLVSVTERTREIGIRKAVGAIRRSILAQFIAEAVVLSEIGGIGGILLGMLGGNIVALLMTAPPAFPMDWAAIGFVLCSLIGVIFGVYPAWKAANLDPIDALRYE